MPDPSGRLELTSELFPRKVTVVKPILYGTTEGKAGTSGATYVPQASRWVPVTIDQVSPDGARYAYEATVSRPGATSPTFDAIDHAEIRVVDIGSGIERVVLKVFTYNDPGVIVHFADEGIYLTKGCPSGCLPDSGQLWLLNLNNGHVTKVTDVTSSPHDYLGRWRFANRIAWDIVQTLTTGGEPVRARLVRLDLVTGGQTTWATWDWSNLVFAVDVATDTTGLPLVIESVSKYLRDISPGYRLVRFDSPNNEEVVTDFSYGGPGNFITERAGTWYVTSDRDGSELFLYAPPEQPRRVAAITGYVYAAEGVVGP